METDTEYVSNEISNYKFSSKKKKGYKIIHYIVKGLKAIFYIAIITIIIFIIKKNILFQIKQKKELTDKILTLEEISRIHQQKLNQTKEMILKLYKKISINSQYKIFNQEIDQKYKEEQNFFCDNLHFLRNNKFENQITKAKVNFNKKTYDMYVFKDSDIVSNIILKSKFWEGYCTLKILEALNYYTNKTNLKNKELYILDIGGNVGWYSFYLGKYGYNIMSFEPRERNFYILRKNYCLNKDVNITIINKGLYTSEKTCDYYEQMGNKGNGMVICNQRNDVLRSFQKRSVVILTKLRNFIEFLSKKHVAFIKIDVEGAEEAAILSGIELISKYHVPFIFLEYCPSYLRMHDVNNKKYLEIFENNGYKMSIISFFDKKYVSVEYLAKINKCFDLYIIYTKILE